MMHAMGLFSVASSALICLSVAYFGFLAALTIPSLQTQAIYLNKVVLTWFQDVNQPTQWGFLPNQVTPFYLQTPDGQSLHAWHILPLGLYERHKAHLVAEPDGAADDFTSRLAFKLLRDDPESLLVLYLHGAAGTLGSGWRPPSYRAMHALSPDRIHTVAIDYRGFGQSTGNPSEEGLLIDAHALLRWAMHEAQIPAHRIVLFGQSLGTAITLSLAHDLAISEPEPIFLKGIVLVAPMINVEELTSTYSIAGIVPLLGPLARFPSLFAFFKSFLICRWPSKDYLTKLIDIHNKSHRSQYDITLIHARDDWDIPWSHSDVLFWNAIEASTRNETQVAKIKNEVLATKVPLGSEGWTMEWKTEYGVLRQEIPEHGLHDRIMSYPVVSHAIWRAFHADE